MLKQWNIKDVFEYGQTVFFKILIFLFWINFFVFLSYFNVLYKKNLKI